MPGILPKMTSKEILESSMIASVSGLITNGKLTKIRPFRAPHHSCSLAAMVGGGIGRKVKPGEISLSHNGILFLDELPEFSPNVIESLRQPIETGEVLISRSGYHVKYPSRFQLIAAMNPCRCGYLLESDKACSRAPKCGQDYLMKISGPIMDRFDLHISVPSVELPNKNISNNETSATVANRVIAARNIQLERYDGYGIRTNSQLDGQMLIEYAMPYDEGVDLLNKSAAVFKLSMRGYNRILRVARTIADLEENKKVKKIHIAEALSYRQVDFFKNNF